MLSVLLTTFGRDNPGWVGAWFDHVERYEDGYVLFPRDVQKVFKYTKATSHRRVHAHTSLIDPDLLQAVTQRLAADAEKRAASILDAAADAAAVDTIIAAVSAGTHLDVRSEVEHDELDEIEERFSRGLCTGFDLRTGVDLSCDEISGGLAFASANRGSWDNEDDDDDW